MVAEPDEYPASWYDGCTALRHEGLLCWGGGDRLVLRHPQGEGVDFVASELRFREGRPGERIYSLEGASEFRLILRGTAPAGIEELLPAPQRYGKWVDRIGLPQAAIAFAMISAVVVATVMTVPGWLGPMVPPSWERRMGEAMIGDFGNRICRTAEGEAALARLTVRLDPGGEPIRVGVVNIGMINAAALPGGQVLLFDGLIQNAESPEEIAGVLAHEIGHVRERHVMTALLRQFGISILASGIGTGFGQNALGLAALGYTREAESEADRFARQHMARADISPQGAADFFERLLGGVAAQAEDANWIGWLDTHPSPANRALEFREAAEPGRQYAPALTDAEFAALRAMCESDEDVEEFDLF